MTAGTATHQPRTSSLTAEPETLLETYRAVRQKTEDLCRPLAVEDYVVQTMADVSPTKWHIAHTSWFFETFVLSSGFPGYHSPRSEYRFLFNSYYNTVGPMYYRPERGFLTRPSVHEVYGYREHVDRHMEEFLSQGDPDKIRELAPIIVLGLNHAQQHQELILTDIKHVLSRNPMYPAYLELKVSPERQVPPLDWVAFPEGLQHIGHEGDEFAFDNETPRHRVFVEAFGMGNRLVTNGEYLEFMEDGGYERPDLWLSDGWYQVRENRWHGPLYWIREDGVWHEFTLGGLRKVNTSEPVCHVSYYEADAYARWVGKRLPTEAEWEVVAQAVPVAGNLLETNSLHPVSLAEAPGGVPAQLVGDVWEWTRSGYEPYPGYAPAEGALGEYNGKFMSAQMVLRGGSCVTPESHIRKTYRNFFPPHSRWQFMGIRLATDA
jgi:ergothioneine biosynthesis protein EgtB